MSVASDITSITNRHVGRILAQLDEANVPMVCLMAVKREFWFLHDDVQQVVVSQNQEVENGQDGDSNA